MAFISRSFRRKYLRLRPLMTILIVIIIIDSFFISKSLPLPTRVELSSTLPTDKIFIASMFRNSEYILRLSYIDSLLALVKHLGPSNVYVSILESGSFDNTKGALQDLKAELDKLGVPNRILTGINHNEQQDMLRTLPPEGQRQGWVYTGRPESKSGKDGWELRRIPYLAAQRNKVMEPLYESKPGTWDKVLWINDVVFTTEDVLTLLATNSGHYAAACALDFQHSPTDYYDTFALRDIRGQKTATQSFPFFHASASLTSMRSLLPVPVTSCWNGMMILSSEPFHTSPPLRFRGVPDSLAAHHIEGSECCLIHADNALRERDGVWVNPNVRVSYNISNYAVLNPREWEGEWPGRWNIVTGVWANRRARWFGWVVLWSEGGVVRRRVRKWIREGKKKEVVSGGKEAVREEPGMECLVNEMQVLYQNGWHHV